MKKVGGDAPRSVGARPLVWAALLLLFAALAGFEGAPASLRSLLAPGHLALTLGWFLLFATAYVLPLARGGPGRFLETFALTVALAAPFAGFAADWAPVDAGRAAVFGLLLLSQAAVAAAASWAGTGAGAERQGRVGSAYLVLTTIVLLGAPFLAYLIGETSDSGPIAAGYASSIWAVRPLLLDRAWALPDGYWIPALAVNGVLATGFAAVALVGRERES